MAFSLDAAIKNIYTSLFGGDEEEVTKEKPKSGLMSSNIRPKSRPANLELVEAPARESVTQAIKGIGDNTTTDDTVGVDVSAVGVNMNAAKLYGTYNTPAHKLISLNKGRDPTSDKFKVLSVQQDDFFDGYLKKLQNELEGRVLRPKARPLSRAERRASYKYSEKDKIMDMQQALNARGITVNGKQLVEDGIRGNNTIKAIRSFQKEEGLKIDGIVGPNTMAALYKDDPVYDVTQRGLDNQAEINAAQKALVQKTQMELSSEVPTTDGIMSQELTDDMDRAIGTVGFADPSIIDPTTGQRYTGPGLMRQQQQIRKQNLFLSEKYEADVVLANREEGTDVDVTSVKGQQQVLKDLGYDVGAIDGALGPITEAAVMAFQRDTGLNPDGKIGPLTKAKLLEETTGTTPSAANEIKPFISEVTQAISGLSPLEQTIAAGYITKNAKKHNQKSKEDGWTSGLFELTMKDGVAVINEEHTAIIEKFFQEAIGNSDAEFYAAGMLNDDGTYKVRPQAWCALFIDHILNKMGVSRLASGKGQDKYDRVRALKYVDYGEAVTGQAPSKAEFNAKAQEGDLVVLHSSYKVKPPNGETYWISFNKVKENEDGTYSWRGSTSANATNAQREADDKTRAYIAKINGKGYQVSNQYHVGFNMGEIKDGYISVLGGNQSNSVNVSSKNYRTESIMAVRRITPAVVKQEIN